MSHNANRAQMPTKVVVSILTLSDTRTEHDDESGKLLCELFTAAGHSIEQYQVHNENPEAVRVTLEEWLARKPGAIVCCGGTGIAARDNTVEVAKSLFTKEIPGFGELFRFLSFQQIGAAAMLSRAVAGVAKESLLVCLPGSAKAVRLATTRILLPEITHIVWEIQRQAKQEDTIEKLQLI